MAKIVDPDQLSQGVEVIFDTVAKTIQLVEAGNLSADGVTLQSLYSFCKEEWKDDADLIKLPFPFEAITEAKFDVINGWDFLNTATKNLIRDGGWSLRDATLTSTEEYFGFVTLGSFVNSGTDRAYYQQSSGGAATNTVYTGPVNEPVKIYGDASHGNVNNRSFFTAFLREQAKTYSSATLADQGITLIDYTVYKLPLANSSDPKIDESDVNIAANAPYTGMGIDYIKGTGFSAWVSAGSYSIDDVVSNGGRWYRAITTHSGVATAPGSDATNWESYVGERLIGASYRAFNVIIDGNSAVAEKIYEFTQYKNRQDANINDDSISDGYGSVTGKTASQLLSFLGDTLITGTGVFIDNFDSNDTNRIEFKDISGTTRTFPFVAAGTINFNANLKNDPQGKYWVFFANAGGNEYGTTSAIIVNDKDGNPLTGSTNGLDFVSFDFDYDGNVQGGRTAATDADIVIVAIGLSTAQFVQIEGTITRAVGQTFSLVSALERNYSNAT